MRRYFTVSDVARQHDFPPEILSNAFYRRLVPDEYGPVVGGRRIISEENVPTILELLVQNGLIGEGTPMARVSP